MKKYAFQKYFRFDGKRYVVYGDSEEEVIVKKALKLKDLEDGKVTVSGSMTVRQWVPRCLDAYKPNVSENYRKEMDFRIQKHILSQIGDMPLKSVKPLQCQDILNNQAGMSKSHIHKLHQELCFIFDRAVENKLILSSPADHLTRPVGTSGKRRSLTDIERKHFLQVCDVEPVFNLFLLMLYCGCRPGEAMECRGTDLTTIEGKDMLHIRGTKTENADRYVPIPADMLKRFDTSNPFDTLCKNHAGRKHSRNSYLKAVNALKRAMNLSMGARLYRNALVPPLPLAPDFCPYMLRHTYCTDLQKAGVDLRAAQKLMGHSDIHMTADIYTHQDNETLLQAADALDRMRGAI